MRKTAGRSTAGKSSFKATGDPAMAISRLFWTRGRDSSDRRGKRLSAQSEPRDERLVARVVARLQIVEKPAAL